MSGSWNLVNGASWVTHAIGGGGAMGTGAYTTAALFLDNANNNAIGSLYDASNVEQRASLVDTQHLYARNDFTGGFSTVTPATWYVGGTNKPGGAAQTYRYHLWPYAAAGTGSFSHGTTGATQGDGNTCTSMRIGTFNVNTGIGHGLIALFAGWSRELSDAEWDTLKSNQLSAWAALSPAFLIDFSNWNGTNGSVDRVGSASFTSLSGVVGVGAEPPSFNYSLSGAQNNSGQMMFFL